MLIEAARRAEAAVREMLACATEGAASCSELLEGLEISKVIDGVNAAFQVSAAASVAGRERHGDGGAEVLAARAGSVTTRGPQPGQDGRDLERHTKAARRGGWRPGVDG